MANVYVGIIVIGVSVLMYYGAFKKFSKAEYIQAVVLIILAGLILRVFVSSDLYLHSWDERYHALVAKNMLKHPFIPVLYENPILSFDYKSWVSNNIWLHKPPLTLWSISLSLKLFGISEFAVRIPSIVFSTLNILVVYLLANELTNKRTAFIAAFFFSIHGLIIELTAGRVATDHVDILFMFLISLSVYFAVLFFRSKKYGLNIMSAIVLGLAVLTKWYAAYVVFPIWILFAIDNSRKLNVRLLPDIAVFLVISALVYSPWLLYINTMFPLEAAWEGKQALLHFTTVIEERTGPFLFHFDKMRILYGEGIYVALVWFLFKSVKAERKYRYLALLAWVFIPYLVYTIAKTKMQAYTLFAAPAMLMILAFFIDFLLKHRKTAKHKWAIGLLILVLFGLPVRYSIERIKPFTGLDRNPEWSRQLKNMLKQFDGKKSVLFGYPRPIEAMFYCHDAVVYSGIPENDKINDLIDNGYKVFVFDKKNNIIHFQDHD